MLWRCEWRLASPVAASETTSAAPLNLLLAAVPVMEWHWMKARLAASLLFDCYAAATAAAKFAADVRPCTINAVQLYAAETAQCVCKLRTCHNGPTCHDWLFLHVYKLNSLRLSVHMSFSFRYSVTR